MGDLDSLDANHLDLSQASIRISISQAISQNEMYLLGDCIIGTEPPLSLRVYADKDKPRTIGVDRTSTFTVKKACICAAGVDVDIQIEERIAWFLIMNGTWNETDELVQVNDNSIDFIEVELRPEPLPDDVPNDQLFRTIGTMSQMIASQYIRSTSSNGNIRNLTPNQQPDEFGVLIPHDYLGSSLKLWRLSQRPQTFESLVGE